MGRSDGQLGWLKGAESSGGKTLQMWRHRLLVCVSTELILNENSCLKVRLITCDVMKK